MKGRPVILAVLSGLLIASVTVSLALGRYPVSPVEMACFLFQKLTGISCMEPQRQDILGTVLIHIRMPRILGAVIVGGALSVSGAVLQAIFINLWCRREYWVFCPALPLARRWGWWFFQLDHGPGQCRGVRCGSGGLAVGLSRFYRGDRILMLVLGGLSAPVFSIPYFC